MNRAVVSLLAAALLTACGSTSVPLATGSPVPSPPASARPVTPIASPDGATAEPAATAAATARADAIQLDWSEVAFAGSISALVADR
jgi:hypothetical protein